MIVLEEETYHHISNSGSYASSSVTQHFRVRQKMTLTSDRSFSDIQSPNMWGYLQYQTIEYKDLGSTAVHTYKNFSYDEDLNPIATTVTDKCTAGPFDSNLGTAHEGTVYTDGCTILGGYDPDYPFMTPEQIEESKCIDNIWPCMEHICGDRYGNFNWQGTGSCGYQEWTASEIVEDIYSGRDYAAYYQFGGEPVRKEECHLSRNGLSYTYYYNGSRSYYMIPREGYNVEDWGTYSADRHFMYKREFLIILPEESNSETGGNE